jgi:hypothetical protein
MQKGRFADHEIREEFEADTQALESRNWENTG